MSGVTSNSHSSSSGDEVISVSLLARESRSAMLLDGDGESGRLKCTDVVATFCPVSDCNEAGRA